MSPRHAILNGVGKSGAWPGLLVLLLVLLFIRADRCQPIDPHQAFRGRVRGREDAVRRKDQLGVACAHLRDQAVERFDAGWVGLRVRAFDWASIDAMFSLLVTFVHSIVSSMSMSMSMSLMMPKRAVAAGTRTSALARTGWPTGPRLSGDSSATACQSPVSGSVGASSSEKYPPWSVTVSRFSPWKCARRPVPRSV
jgi:hypothetical protein